MTGEDMGSERVVQAASEMGRGASGETPSPLPPSAATKRKKGAPSKRERELCEAIRDAADDVTKATDYAQGYMARAALIRAMQSLKEWAMAGRPHA